jgi:hypothetical protein
VSGWFGWYQCCRGDDLRRGEVVVASRRVRSHNRSSIAFRTGAASSGSTAKAASTDVGSPRCGPVSDVRLGGVGEHCREVGARAFRRVRHPIPQGGRSAQHLKALGVRRHPRREPRGSLGAPAASAGTRPPRATARAETRPFAPTGPGPRRRQPRPALRRRRPARVDTPRPARPPSGRPATLPRCRPCIEPPSSAPPCRCATCWTTSAEVSDATATVDACGIAVMFATNPATSTKAGSSVRKVTRTASRSSRTDRNRESTRSRLDSSAPCASSMTRSTGRRRAGHPPRRHTSTPRVGSERWGCASTTSPRTSSAAARSSPWSRGRRGVGKRWDRYRFAAGAKRRQPARVAPPGPPHRAVAAQDQRSLLAQLGDECVHQPRLADARISHHRGQARLAGSPLPDDRKHCRRLAGPRRTGRRHFRSWVRCP